MTNIDGFKMVIKNFQPPLRKKYFIADTPEGRNSGFKRLSYTLLDTTKWLTLVHYIGDENIEIMKFHRLWHLCDSFHDRSVPQD